MQQNTNHGKNSVIGTNYTILVKSFKNIFLWYLLKSFQSVDRLENLTKNCCNLKLLKQLAKQSKIAPFLNFYCNIMFCERGERREEYSTSWNGVM